MSRNDVMSLVAIVGGVLVIVFSRWIAQRYLISYNKVLGRLLPLSRQGPLFSPSRLHYWYIAVGIAWILIGLSGLAGYLKHSK